MSNLVGHPEYHTFQKVFDLVSTHLLTQMEPAVTPGERKKCMYYIATPEGKELRCAIGCLIPEKDYRRYRHVLEGRSVERLINICPTFGSMLEDMYDCDLGHFFKDWKSFLGSLQGIHDQNLPEFWHEELQGFAEQRGLTFTPPPIPE